MGALAKPARSKIGKRQRDHPPTHWVSPVSMNTDHARVRASTIHAIERAVAHFFGMSVEELHQKSTTRAVTVPRQIAMYLAKHMTDASLTEIGRHFGGRHHTTVMDAIAKVEEQRRREVAVASIITVLVKSIRGLG